MQGWIKLHRSLMDKPIWFESTPEQKTILITLLMMANHKEKEWEWGGKPYKAEPGEFITSLESIARKAGKGISIQNVRTALKRFEKYGFLTNKSTNKNRLITIVNWALYQQEDGELTSNLTSNQQATNKQLTTNKNVKNDKNEKNDKYIHALFEHYVSKGIIRHQKLTESMKTAIRARLKDYSFEDLKKAIDNYAAVLKSDMHWFNHKYPLADFMRDKDVRKFVDEADPLNNFRNRDYKQNRQPVGYDPNRDAF